MLLYGASGHAKVIIDCLESQMIPVTGIFDDDLSKKELLGYKVLGAYNPNYLPNEQIIISIGENNIREMLSTKVGHKFASAQHISATVSKNVIIGEGTVIIHKSIPQSSVKVGKHIVINTAASISHDCIIDNFAHISPNATVCGNVKIGEGTHIGAAAVIIPNITIGKWCKIGAGAVIMKDVPDYSVVVGNPGQIIKTINAQDIR